MIGYGLAGASLAALIVLAVRVIQAVSPTPSDWDESICGNPRCRHSVHDHRSEVEGGACWRFGCQCQRFRRSEDS